MLHYYAKNSLRFIFCTVVIIQLQSNVAAISQGNRVKKKIHKAENYFDKGDFYNSMKLFEELLVTDPNSAYYHYHLGVCKYQIRHLRNESLAHFEKSNAKIDTEIYYYLGVLYHAQKDFDKAYENLNKYLSLPSRVLDTKYVEQLISDIASAQKLIKQPVSAEFYNLGESINTSNSEYVPLITADGNKLFFTSRREGSTDGKVDALGQFYEDIYMSEIVDFKWNYPIQLPAPVNTSTHDACVGLTPEGENLLIYRTNSSMTSGDILLTESDGTKWLTPVLLDPVINTEEWNEPSACFSPDGNSIYFSSNREGGFGGKDLYRTVRLPGGKWSTPVNLGPNINTPFDDDAPFVHSNGKEFYFSSQGHENMGGFDVFKAYIDSNGMWQKAINMGSPINSVEDDIYLVLTADGQTGFLSSTREGGFGEADIYTFHFTNLDPGYLVSEGYVKDENGEPLNAKITVIETDLMKIHGVYKSSRLTGKFIYLHCEDHDYEIVVESEGYASKTIYVAGDEFNTVDIQLKKTKE